MEIIDELIEAQEQLDEQYRELQLLKQTLNDAQYRYGELVVALEAIEARL